MTACR